jgi:hypothetical protein
LLQFVQNCEANPPPPPHTHTKDIAFFKVPRYGNKSVRTNITSA